MNQPVVIERETLRDLIDCATDIARVDEEIGDEDAASFANELASKGKAALSTPFIPVSERLPENGQTCEVILANGSRIAECVYRGGIASGFYFLGTYLSVDDWSKQYAVTHWKAKDER